MTIALAVLFGCLFGFVLHRVLASNPEFIINMLRLKNFYLMKVILFAIGFASILSFAALNLGFLPAEHFSVKSSYVGVFVGGLILGLGWALSGYCPGTGVVAAGEGRIDAWFFVLGGLVGAFLYMISYSFIEESFLFNDLGGKVTLAATGNESFKALLNFPGMLVAGIIGLLFILIAFILPENK